MESVQERDQNSKQNERGIIINRKWLSLVAGVVVICVLGALLIAEPYLAEPLQATKPMDFTVSGTNDCLRFLNDSVSIVYVPFTVSANQNWQLTVNCTKMPGGNNGYTDVYIYNGFWNNGTNNVCTAAQVYPILAQIQSANYEIKGATSYNQTFGGSQEESYTIFFVFPPGGQATFHVTYVPVSET